MNRATVVFLHSRLIFKDSATILADFIRRRFEHAGLETPQFVMTREDVAAAVDSLAKNHELVAVHDAMNPLPDLELLQAMQEGLERSNQRACISNGAIPGTQIAVMLRTARHKGFDFDDYHEQAPDVLRLRWGTQEKFHNQFNIYKYKRLKMFLGLREEVENLHELSIPELCQKIEEPKIHRKLLSYCEPVNLEEHQSCPHCDGKLAALSPRVSQPFLGYLPPSVPYYFECEACRLIVLSPFPTSESIPLLYDDFDKQDFVVSVNNAYNTGNARCDFAEIQNLLPSNTRSLDLGGGVGRFSQFLKTQHSSWDVTHSDLARYDNSELEKQGIKSRELNFLTQEIGRADYDLITAWEVVEHIPFESFDGVLGNIHRGLAENGLFRFSTPDFDSAMCQGYDFFNACPPFHLTVFSSFWLKNYFNQSPDWKIVETRSCSDFLDDAVGWFDYGMTTCPNFQLRGLSEVLKKVFSSKHADDIRQELLSADMGTEIVMTVQKQ